MIKAIACFFQDLKGELEMPDKIFYATFTMIGKHMYLKVYAEDEADAREKLRKSFHGNKKFNLYNSEEDAGIEYHNKILWGTIA